MNEWSVLEAKVATLEQQIAMLTRYGGQQASLPPDVFQNSNAFSVLPHEAAAVYTHASTQTVVSGSSVVLAFNEGGATWGKGMEPHSTGASTVFDGISVVGINRDAVALCQAWVEWEPNSSGVRAMTLLIDDGSEVHSNATPLSTAVSLLNTIQHLTHMRLVKSDQNLYQLKVSQNSGSNLGVAQAYLSITRLR